MFVAAAASQAVAQQVAVSLGSGSTVPGGAVGMNISLVNSGGASPAGVQWTMSYSSSVVSSVSVVTGSGATTAGKSATCSSATGTTTCLLSGMNQTILGNGVLALATFTISPNAVTSSVPIQVTAVSASTAGGQGILSTGAGGTISVGQSTQPSLIGLACTPGTISAPGIAVCTATLSAPSLAGGFSVTLASNNSSVSIPVTLNVPAAASSAAFTATVSAVSTPQTANLTASAGATTRTFSLSIVTAALWSISGAVTPSSLGSGAMVALSGGATTTADGSGNYKFSGLVNGSYTLTPSKSGYTFTPPSQPVTLSSANLTSVNFTAVPNATYGTITVDAQVWQDQSKVSSVVTSPTFSTVSNGELLLAFISAGYRSGTNTTVMSVSGAGLTWVLVVRTQVQGGTAEIWRAFSQTPLNRVSVTASLSGSVTSSITVMSFAGVDPSGVNGSGAIGAIGRGSGSIGAPTATLITTRNNSLIVGVGDDSRRATARTAGPEQTLVHQYLDPAGSTYWVQRSSSSTSLSGGSVTINDPAPTADSYNLSISEILAGSSVSSSIVGGAMTIPVMAAFAGTNSNQGSDGTLILTDLAGFPVTNACSPGGRVALMGTDFTSQAPQTSRSFPLPTELAGLQVKVNGIPTPLFFASDSQVTFQCPLLPPGTLLDVSLEGPSGIARSPVSVMREAAPELFTLGATNQGVILLGATNEIAMPTNQAVPSRPAQIGEFLSIYASGLGEVNDGVPTGTPAPLGSPVMLKNRIHVVVGGIEIDPIFAGLAQGTVGLSRVDAQIPPGVLAGPAVPLYVQVILPDGTVVESNEVTVAIDDTPIR